MVSEAYMKRRERRQSDLPGPASRFLYDTAWPLLVDSAAEVEAVVYQAGEAARRRPVTALAAALAVGFLLHRAVAAAWRPRRRS